MTKENHRGVNMALLLEFQQFLIRNHLLTHLFWLTGQYGLTDGNVCF